MDHTFEISLNNTTHQLDKQNNVYDYRELLDAHNISYSTSEYYLHVGQITWTQGWILNITVVKTQIVELLKSLIPLLTIEDVPFKIAKSEELARSISNGAFGYVMLGKVVTIYPLNDEQALRIAKKLILTTASFKGPRVLTDRHLGSIIYTRYGACAPVIFVNERGAEDEYIYDSEGKLIKDQYRIPFVLPTGISWPFADIVSHKVPAPETVLQDKYKPMSLLKDDAKGDVKKTLWLKKIYDIRWCVVKEGKQYMNTDSFGRDIGDRLKWQYDLHKSLQGVIPIPQIYDLFQENGDTYLVMEYIKGKDLDNIVLELFHNKTWKQIQLSEKILLFNYAEQLLNIIELMHNKGYIHRDITPGNFLVTKNKKIWMIDLELSYSVTLQRPFPPFRLGTPGFMSPEQEVTKSPTVYEDIYAIGGILITMFTALFPTKFATRNNDILKNQLHFFIPDKEFVNTISNCFNDEPESRSTISEIRVSLKKFSTQQLVDAKYFKTDYKKLIVDKDVLEKSINSAIKGLTLPIMMNRENIWLSKTIQEEGLDYYQMESGTVYTGFYEGLSGILFLLARAKKMGFSISTCMDSYTNSLEFIRRQYGQWSITTPAGLYGGTAGIAVALAEGVDSGLIPDSVLVKQEIRHCLEQTKTEGNAIAKGIAGKGIALLKASNLLDEAFVYASLNQLVEDLIQQQQKDGSWVTDTGEKKELNKIAGLNHGVAGITYFLLSYIQQCTSNSLVHQSAINALAWLMKQTKKRKKKTYWYTNNRNKLISPWLDDGTAGIILCFLKAYEVFKDQSYLQIAENALKGYPTYWTNRDITQVNGLTGIGEIYLEAARLSNNEEWKNRVDWLVQYLLHHNKQQPDGSLYWLSDTTPFTTAGLMGGNSGIIHFLLRYYDQGKTKYIL